MLKNQIEIKMPTLLLITVCLFTSGCAKLSHLQELLTLKDLSENKDSQEAYIKEQDENFERLLKAVDQKTITKYTDEKSFLKNFGKPLLVRTITENSVTRKKWLYRYSAKSFGSPKVYLTFDQSGHLVFWQYLPRSEEDPLDAEANMGALSIEEGKAVDAASLNP